MIRQTVLGFKIERTEEELTAHGGLALIRGLVDRRVGAYLRRWLWWARALVLLAGITTGWSISEGGEGKSDDRVIETDVKIIFKCSKEESGTMTFCPYDGGECKIAPIYKYYLWEIRQEGKKEGMVEEQKIISKTIEAYGTLAECEKRAAELDRDRGEAK